MARRKQVADSKRRAPQQARARDTVEVIFEATARILLREGAGALNTNYIAERAGVSVGTLYGYFPNKVAILLAMARREITRATAAVLKAIGGADAGDDPVRRAIRALITEFSRNRKARHIAFQTLVAEGYGAELEANMDEIAGALAASTERIIPGRGSPIPAVSAFVLTRAVNGVLVSASNERSPYMSTAEFEDELVRLVRGFLSDLPRSQSLAARENYSP